MVVEGKKEWMMNNLIEFVAINSCLPIAFVVVGHSGQTMNLRDWSLGGFSFWKEDATAREIGGGEA